MDCKEKAEKLVERFWFFAGDYCKITGADAKKCALICVDEIIKAQYIDLEKMFDTDFAIANIRNQSKYWQEEKQEIEKL